MSRAYLIAVVGATALAGALVVVAPLVLLAAIGGAVAVLLLLQPWGRLLWVTGGGVLVLGSSSGATPTKLGWLAGVLVCVLVAWRRWGGKGQAWQAPFRRVFTGAWLLAVLLLASALVGLHQGASFTDVFRDGLNYAVLALAPLLALDAARDLRPAVVDRIIVLVSLLATVGFAVTFIARRGVGTVDVNAVLLPSTMLMALGVALGTVRATAGKRVRWRWMWLPPLVIAGQLVTGTRTGLLLIVGVVAAWGVRRRGGAPLSRLLGALGAAAVLVAAVVGLLAGRLVAPGFLEQRAAAVLRLANGGLALDQSQQLRVDARRISLAIWHQHPVLGVGLGAHFPDPTGNSPFALFTLDSPALYLAKFGVVGSAGLLAALALMLSPLVMVRRFSPERTALRAWVLTAAGVALLDPVTEDKGFGMALMLALTLLGAALRDGDVTEGDRSDDFSVAIGSQVTAVR